jgi:hypothetical protein
MKNIVVLFLCLITEISFSQVISKAMIHHTPGYTLSLSIQNHEFTYVYDKPEAQPSGSFTLTVNEEAAFINGFKKLVKTDADELGLRTENEIVAEGYKLFYYFKGVEDLSDDLQYQPIAGTIDLNSQDLIPVFKLRSDRSLLKRQVRDTIKLYRKLSRRTVENQNAARKLDLTRTVLVMERRALDKGLLGCERQIVSLKSREAEIQTSLHLASLAKMKYEKSENDYISTNRSRSNEKTKQIKSTTQRDSTFDKSLTESKEKIKKEIGDVYAKKNELLAKADSVNELISNIDSKIRKYSSTQPYRVWVHRRWFRYNGEIYGRSDFKRIMLNEILKVDDKKNGIFFAKHKDTIVALLAFKKSLKSTIPIAAEYLSVSNKSLMDLQALVKRDTLLLGKKIEKLQDTLVKMEVVKKLRDNLPWTIKKIGRYLNSFEDFKSQIYLRPHEMQEIVSDEINSLKLNKDSLEMESQKAVLKKKNKDELKKINDRIEKIKAYGSAMTKFIGDDMLELNRSRKDSLNLSVILDETRYDTLKPKFNDVQDVVAKILYAKRDLSSKKGTYDSLVNIRSRIEEQLGSFRKSILKDISRSYNNKLYEQAIRIKSFQIEITDGFIENIQVIGVIGNKFTIIDDSLNTLKEILISEPGRGELKLQNKHPFGFSRKIDYENLKDKYLYNIEENGPGYKLYLQNLFNAKTYVENLANHRRDYSPADTVILFDEKHPTTHYELKKDPTYKLFEARVYSDFVGLDKNNPNGLIQTEISKRVNLITYRTPLGKKEGANFGWFGYVIPAVTLSKIEQSNRDLLLNRIDSTGGKYAPIKYASTLNIRRHENFSTGFDLNIGTFDIPKAKSTFQIDFGFRYGRVSIVDSSRAIINGSLRKIGTNYDVNTFRIYPKLGWLIRTDERYSFYFESGFNWYWLRDESFKQVANDEVFRSSRNAGGQDTNKYINFLFEATLNTGAPNKPNKGKLFFRYQYNYQYNYFNTGFQQAQVGYSFYLLRR